MSSPTDPIEELAAQVAAARRSLAVAEARLAELRPASAGGRRGWRRIAAMAVTIAVIAMPMVTIASDTFADVPNSHQFHNDINRLYGSRITAGCGGGNFCPDTPVTRGQMAAFLNRGLGRLATASAGGGIDGASTSGTLGSVTITANNVTGGSAFVQIQTAFNLYALEAEQGTGCECELYFWLTDEANTIVSNYVYADFDPRALTSDNDNDLGVVVLGVQAVPTGVAKTYTLRYSYLVGTADFIASGRFVATTYAFAGNGSNSFAAPAFSFGGAKEPSASAK